MSNKENEKKNKEYLEGLLGNEEKTVKTETIKQTVTDNYTPPSAEYSLIDINLLPAARFYPRGVKISIRASKVSEGTTNVTISLLPFASED